MQVPKTNLPDWSSLIPVLPGQGPRLRELYAALRRLIETGQLAPGTKLPPSRALAERLKMSRAAVVGAFEQLQADGFVESRIGAGTFVARHVPLLEDAPPPPAPPPPIFPIDAPGTLGRAIEDRRTLTQFRRLLNWHLTRPGPEFYSYGDPRGGLALRQALADYLRTARGVRCTPEQIILTSGTQQGLDLTLRLLLKPGDAAWMEDPGYPRALTALRGFGALVAGVPVDGEGLDPMAGDALCPMARLAYVTPSHQFPLGVPMSMRRRLALIAWAKKREAWIIEDDYDSEFRYAGPPLTSLQGLDDSGRVIYLGSFSKVLMPGLRMGYLVAPPELLDPMVALRHRNDRQPSVLAEAALADLITQGHFAAHLRRVRKLAEDARDALASALPPPYEVTVPAQGLHLLARLPDHEDDQARLTAAQNLGMGGRALSSLYHQQSPQQGLVLGFSGYSPQQMRDLGNALSAYGQE